MVAAVDKKGIIMEINNRKNHISCIIVSFVTILFAICFTMNVFFGGADNLCKLLDKTTAIETWAISKDIAANEDGDNTTYLNASYLNENNSFNETITKHICTIPTIAVIPKGFSLHLVLVIAFLFFFLTLFKALSDEWTLVDQKVRLDN